MKKLSLVYLVATLFALSGCAQLKPDYKYVIDYDKVNAVNNSVKNSYRNVHLIWVNPPTKQVKRTEENSDS